MFITDASINLMLDNQFVSGASNMMLSLHSAYSAAIDITGQAAAGCVVSAVTEDVYSGTGTHTISTYSLSL